MVCMDSCLLSALILSSIITTFFTNKLFPSKYNLKEMLDEEQKAKYNSIVKERLLIFLFGMGLGIGLAYFIIENYTNVTKNEKICLFILLSYSICVMVYMLFPKRKEKIRDFLTDEQISAWREVGKEMSLKYKLGLVLGLVGYYVLGDGIFKNK